MEAAYRLGAMVALQQRPLTHPEPKQLKR